MTQDLGGGQQVDWDAVFRTIDQQQTGTGTGTDVARDLGQGGGSGSSTLQHEGYSSHWPLGQSHAHGQESRTIQAHEHHESLQTDSELLQYFDRQMRNGGPSNHNTTPRTMEPPSRQDSRHEAESGVLGRQSVGPAIMTDDYNVAFRAMMGEDNRGTIPPPRERPTRGRRRSHSLGPRRTFSDGVPGLGPLTGPLGSLPTFATAHDTFPFPSPSLHRSNPYVQGSSTSAQHPTIDDTDFFALLSQAEANINTHTDTDANTRAKHSHASTPQHPYSYSYAPGQRGTKRPSMSTSTINSQDPTPLNSAYPSPSALGPHTMPRFYHHGMNGNGSGSGGDSIRPADQGGGSLNGNGAEFDSEDKRARNTQASARFRAKRKAHISEVERQITHLEGRSTTLQKQVEDLRKENEFLKEMVQLKYGLDVDQRMRQ